MDTYIVTNIATSKEVYRYYADAPIEWNGMAITRVRRDHPAHQLLGAGWSESVPINRVQTAEETSMKSVRLRDSIRWSLDCVALQIGGSSSPPNKGTGNG